MKKILAFFILLTLHLSCFGIDNEITVLALSTGGANTALAHDQMTYLEDNWPNNGGITLNLVNNGTPVLLTSTVYTGSAIDQLIAISGHANFNNLRNTHAADIIIVFTGDVSDSGGVCGRAIQTTWLKFNGVTGSFVPDVSNNNLDLRASENGFIALVANGSQDSCDDELHVAAHEFGHLLGGGHTRLSDPSGDGYLFSDSYSIASAGCLYGGCFGFKYILASGNPPICQAWGQDCTTTAQYSNNGTDKNQRAFATTALSVANYRIAGISGGGSGGGGGGGGGGCSLQTPTLVTGYLVTQCTPNFNTEHSITWLDGCPSATSKYEIWYSQPVGAPYVKGWDRSVGSTPAFVSGAHGRVKIKACNASGQCTGLSSTSYLATFEC